MKLILRKKYIFLISRVANRKKKIKKVLYAYLFVPHYIQYMIKFSRTIGMCKYAAYSVKTF